MDEYPGYPTAQDIIDTAVALGISLVPDWPQNYGDLTAQHVVRLGEIMAQGGPALLASAHEMVLTLSLIAIAQGARDAESLAIAALTFAPGVTASEILTVSF